MDIDDDGLWEGDTAHGSFTPIPRGVSRERLALIADFELWLSQFHATNETKSLLSRVLAALKDD